MPPRQEISQDVWELHQAEIRKLYLETGMSLDMIRTEMDKKHCFCPSKSQYETVFRKWNLRKNLSRSDWEFVGHRIKKRKADGKETDVYLNDTLISSKRVKKELGRYFTPSYTQSYTAPSPQTPPDIAIQSPKNLATFEIQLENLPWFQFQGMFESHTQDLVSRMSDARVRTPFVNLPVFPDTAPSTGFALGFSAQEGSNQLATSSIFAGLIPPSTKQDTVHSFMQAISLERTHGDFLLSIQKLFGPFNHDAFTEFVKFAAYLSSNNMLSNHQSDQFLRWVIETNNHSALRAFFSMKMPTVESFARCIFESALRIGDAAVLRILLEAGVDPGPFTRMNGMTPLQIVVHYCGTEPTRILLDAGVDVNTLTCGGERTALHIAVWRRDVEVIQMLLRAGADVNHVAKVSLLEEATNNANCDVDTQIVQILLGAGANTETPVWFNTRRTALQAAAECGNVELARLLLGAGADANAPAASPIGQSDSGTVLQNVAGGEKYELAIELTRLLLNAGACINAPAGWYSGTGGYLGSGITALQGAAKSGSVAMVLMLLDAGADVNAPAGLSEDKDSMNALEAAASSGSVEIVRALLAAGAEVNVQAACYYDVNRTTALQWAAGSGSVELVRMLLDAGAVVNAQAGGAHKPLTALERAAESGSVELVQMLLDAGADITAPGCSALSSAVRAEQHSIALVRVLMAAGADVNGNHECGRPLIIAAQNGNIDLVRLFLDAGANVDVVVWEALKEAIQFHHNDLVQVLLDASADFNASPPGAVLWAAVGKNDIDLVRNLLDAGAKPSANYADLCDKWISNPLPLAVQNGNIEMVQLLIGAIADVNTSACGRTKWDGGGTALLSAVWCNSVKLVKLLLKAGADVNARPQPFGGWTTLQAAAHHGNTELVRILLGAGADINAPAYFDIGRTALQAAVIEGHTELARHLLEAGADASAPAAECGGVTALQGAAIRGQLGIALMLIQAGADPNAPPAEYFGRTALQGAAEHGRLDMLQLLLNADAFIGDLVRARELAEKNGHVVVHEFLKGF